MFCSVKAAAEEETLQRPLLLRMWVSVQILFDDNLGLVNNRPLPGFPAPGRRIGVLRKTGLPACPFPVKRHWSVNLCIETNTLTVVFPTYRCRILANYPDVTAAREYSGDSVPPSSPTPKSML